jgi:hypothetical protein
LFVCSGGAPMEERVSPTRSGCGAPPLLLLPRPMHTPYDAVHPGPMAGHAVWTAWRGEGEPNACLGGGVTRRAIILSAPRVRRFSRPLTTPFPTKNTTQKKQRD